MAQLWSPTISRQNGARSALIAALRYQKYVIQTLYLLTKHLPTYQTVSEEEFSKVRLYEGVSHPYGC